MIIRSSPLLIVSGCLALFLNVSDATLTITNEFPVSKGVEIGSMPTVGMEWRLAFDYKTPTNPMESAGWPSNVLRAQSSTGNCCEVGQRLPIVVLRESDASIEPLSEADGTTGLKFYVDYPIDTGNTLKDHTVYSKPLSYDTWNTIEIQQVLENGKYMYSIVINGIELENVENIAPQVYTDVKVFASDTYYQFSANGFMRNLIFENLEAPTYTGGSSMQPWQGAADLCTAAGKTLPIPRSEAEVHALCTLSPNSYVWTGIKKGAQPNSYINYLDQSPAPYMELIGNCATCNCPHCTSPNPNRVNENCMALLCYAGVQNQYTFMNLPCNRKGTNIFNFCEDPQEPNNEWSAWGTWSACTDPCMGDSTRTRSRSGYMQAEGESEPCTDSCVFTTKECRAWGDPHVHTFDGAQNDVYGRTTYVLSQSKSTAQAVRKFRVRMETAAYGSVSTAEKALLDFYDFYGTHVATVETDKNGNANFFTAVNLWISQPLMTGMTGPGYSFSFTKIGTTLTVVTDFHVEVTQTGIEIKVRIPNPSYVDKVEGLCGDNDAVKENDYQLPDGTVLDYITAISSHNTQTIAGYETSNSEYQCAQSWMITGAIDGRKKRSISNAAGPHPASVSCTDETIKAECDVLLDAKWLSICEPLVSADRRTALIKACKVDYCMLKEPKTKMDIIAQYVIECQKNSPEMILCDWEVQVTGQTPKCKTNEEYKGCATRCDVRSCHHHLNNIACTPNLVNVFSSCVCKKNFYLLNGECVAEDACSATGWSEWNEWSNCSNPCGGTRRRLKICQGEDCTASSQSDEEKCTGDCNPCVEANCHVHATCDNKVSNERAVCECNEGFDGDGTTCLPQAVTTGGPCPSSECWDFAVASNSCVLKDSCVKLDCGAAKMTMSVKEGVFAEDSETVTGSLVDSDGYYNVECTLGNHNCETHSFSKDGSTLTFASTIQVTGDSRTRSVDNNVIDLGNGLMVITSPFGVGVDFTCNYDSIVAVSSSPFTVQDVSISGTHSASGKLDLGFTMLAGDGSAIILGDDIVVKTSWALDLSDITPHYQNCKVTIGTTSVSIVKSGCMATTLGAESVANAGGVTDSVSMKYKTFTIEDEVATTQEVTCDVKLCAGTTNCAKALICTQSNDPYGYQ